MANSILIALYVLSIVAGVGMGYWLGARDLAEMDKEDPEGRPHFREHRRSVIARQVLGGVIVLLAVFTTTQAYASINRDREQVAANQEQINKQAACNRALIDGISTRARLNSEDQELDRDDSAQIRKALRLYLNPPPGVTDMQAFQNEVTKQLEASLQENEDQRIENAKAREQTPVNPPECEGVG